MTVFPASGAAGKSGKAWTGTVTTTMSPAAAASQLVAADARGPSSAAVSASASGPRELLSTTRCPAAMASRATVLPICPLPMNPTVVIFSASLQKSRTLLMCRIRCDPGSLPSARGEVVAVVQIGEQAGLSGFPAEGPARDEVGRRVALRDYVREEPEVSRHHQFVYGNAHGGQAQAGADGLGDLAERDALVPNRVPVFASRALPQRQAEHGSDIEDVHGVPQVRTVSGVAGEALLLRERDQYGEEAGTIGRAVRDIGNPHDRRPHSPLGEVDYGGFHDIANPKGALVLIAGGKGRVLLGGRPAQLPGRTYIPRRDQRLSGSGECLAVREHDRELRGGHGVHPAGRKQVLPECDVDDAVGVRGDLQDLDGLKEAAAD